jgi:hypothetical protein
LIVCHSEFAKLLKIMEMLSCIKIVSISFLEENIVSNSESPGFYETYCIYIYVT